jgi:hypothetical protein
MNAMGRMMETRLLIMKPDEPNERRTIELPERPGYPEIRDLVRLLIPGCEHIEHVSVLADFNGGLDFRRSDMFVDEDGHAKRLPRNENATIIYRRNALMHQGVKDAETLSWIVGTAVLFQRTIWT